MCDFPVIARFDFCSLCDNGVKSRSVPFHFGWRVLPCAHGGKRFLDCMWVRLLPMGPKDHMQKRSYLTRSLCCPWGERQNFEGMDETVAHRPRDRIPKMTISCQLWMDGFPDRSMWWCGLFVINYIMLDFMALELYY